MTRIWWIDGQPSIVSPEVAATAMDLQREKVARALAAGNPLALVVDGIGEDENLSGAEQTYLSEYARSVAEGLS